MKDILDVLWSRKGPTSASAVVKLEIDLRVVCEAISSDRKTVGSLLGEKAEQARKLKYDCDVVRHVGLELKVARLLQSGEARWYDEAKEVVDEALPDEQQWASLAKRTRTLCG
jgi:hypothetical protein